MNQVDEAEIEFEDNFLEILDQFTFSEKYEVTKLSASTLPEMPELDRILNLIPKFGAEYTSHEDTNPLEVNLRTAVSDQKGCYPGQEVIEKIISLGSPSKKLCLLEGVLENISLPTKLLGQNGTEAGILTSYDQGFALAIVKRNFLKDSEKFLVGSQTLTLRKISET
jgi:folate-binding protein YgfZ